MDPYIDLQECDYLIQKQLKHDRVQTDQQQTDPTSIALAPLNHHLNVILRKDEHKKDLVNYLHGCCFWPVKSTFLTVFSHCQTINRTHLHNSTQNSHQSTTFYVQRFLLLINQLQKPPSKTEALSFSIPSHPTPNIIISISVKQELNFGYVYITQVLFDPSCLLAIGGPFSI